MLTSLWLLIVPVLTLVAVCIDIVWLHTSDPTLGGLVPLSIACLCQALCVVAVLTVYDCLPRKRRDNPLVVRKR